MKITEDEDEYIHHMRRDIVSETPSGIKVKIHLSLIGQDVLIEEYSELCPGLWRGVTIPIEMLGAVIEFMQKVKKDKEEKE